MSTMLERAAKADHVATEAFFRRPARERNVAAGGNPRWRRELEKERSAAILLAALDPHDSDLQAIILGAMGFWRSDEGEFGPMARVQAHDAIEALRKAISQGVSNG